MVLGHGTALDLETTEEGESCEEDYQLEPLISVYDPDGGHAAQPDYYDYHICVESEYTETRDSCETDQNFLFSLYEENDTHINTFEDEDLLQMCAEDLETEVVSDTKCENGTKAASITSETDDTHVAYPSVENDPYSHSICFTTREPENVTVSMEGFSTDFYADGEEITTGETRTRDNVDYPYISTDQPLGIVSYGSFLKLEKGNDRISVTQEDGSFLLPNTRGGHISIEDEQTDVAERQFLGNVEPSFGFVSPSEPTVRVKYSPEQEVRGFNDTLPRNFELAVRNSPEFDTGLEIQPR